MKRNFKKYLIGLVILIILLAIGITCKLPSVSTEEIPTTPDYEAVMDEQMQENAEEDTEIVDNTTEDEIFYVTDQLVESVEVLRFVDGDTIWVKDWQGNEYKVRLIGTVCEESASLDETKNTEGGRLASEFIQTQISIGDTVYLQVDVSDTDIYGRALRYVWIEYPTSVTEYNEIYNKMLNAIIIREGYGKVGYYKPDVSNYNTFKLILNEAKENNRGLWEDYWK